MKLVNVFIDLLARICSKDRHINGIATSNPGDRMPKHPVLVLLASVYFLMLAIVSCSPYPLHSGVLDETPATPTANSKPVDVFPNTHSVPRYGILELDFSHDGVYRNSFVDVDLDIVFTSPSNTKRRVKGFFYDNGLWKVRFRPDEVGVWTYTFVLTSKNGLRGEGSGNFDCTLSDARGPIRRNPEHPYRWMFSNGEPYFPIGLQDCIFVNDAQLGKAFIDGEQRNDGQARQVSMQDYFSIYGDAGFNLFRFSQNNCSFSLVDDLDHYRIIESKVTDELLALAYAHGFRVIFGFFGFYANPGSPGDSTPSIEGFLGRTTGALDEQKIAKEKQFIAYCIARWGVYVDFWQLLNESAASDEWTIMMANYVHSIDPDQKPIGTNWEKPYLPTIDINTPHWYESESELESDLRVQQQAETWKEAGKPVMVGEQGNTGMNWDPLSGQRMRIRSWTALFQEVSFVFWNSSWSKFGMYQGTYTSGAPANIYLGPEERGYIRVLQSFSSQLNTEMRMVPVQVSSPTWVRAYGLVSNSVAGVYLHHFADHATYVRDLNITLDLPIEYRSSSAFDAKWIDPSTGDVIAHTQTFPGTRTLEVPPFVVDLALLVTPAPVQSSP